MAADFFLGESLVGDGNEVAHIDLIIGSKSGPAGSAFCNALANNKDGFTTLLAVVAPNLPAKPDTLLFNKVTIKGAKQAVQMFGPAQAAVARAVVDSVASGVIPKDKADDLCILVGVFIHWDASDDQKIYDYNYQATKESIARALGKKPTRGRSDLRLEDGQAPVRPSKPKPNPTPNHFQLPIPILPIGSGRREWSGAGRWRWDSPTAVRKLLLQLDTSPHPSVFDRVVAHDGGADEVMSYGGVTEDAVRDLVHGAIFTRGPKDLHNTAIFIGGTDMAAGERLLGR